MVVERDDEVTSLLTDDEIVALALQSEVIWPVALSTVAVESLAAAGSRGRRSLAVRGLRGESSKESVELLELVTAVGQAKSWSAAFAASEKNLEPAGSSTFVFGLEDGSVVVDIVEAGGVHRLARSTAADATFLLTALAKNVFDFGFVGGAVDGRLIIGSSASSSWITVQQGQIRNGRLVEGMFVTGSESPTWEAGLISTLVEA